LYGKITRIKPIGQIAKINSELSRKDLVMFGVGGTIGAGIFALTGIAA
jgi:L-asparagine transporter-like permease